MSKQILTASTAAIVAIVLAGSAMAFDGGGAHKSALAIHNDLRHDMATPPYRRRLSGTSRHDRLPFGPVQGALYSYGSGRACSPYDPFTDLYGYCGGPYKYR
jgi:hypothetical protein